MEADRIVVTFISLQQVGYMVRFTAFRRALWRPCGESHNSSVPLGAFAEHLLDGIGGNDVNQQKNESEYQPERREVSRKR